MKNVLITGSSGFVGKNLIKYLNDQNINFIEMNLRDGEPGADYGEGGSIVHLAGKAHDLAGVSAPDEYYQVNFEITKNLYNSFLKSRATKFIFISSVKASVDQMKGILKESDTPDPKTHYGKSKLMAEEYIKAQALPAGKQWYILRPCMIHGPGNKGNLNFLFKLISKGLPYPLAAFENKRSFLSVENLSFVIHELLDRNDIPSGIYNVADDEALSTNELIKLIALASEKKALLWKINRGLIRSLAKLGDSLKLTLTTERLNKLTEDYIVDNTKIKQALQKDLPIQARDGLIKTLKSFISEVK